MICVLDGRVVLVHLSGQLVFYLFCFFQVRLDFLLLPDLSVHSLSDERKGGEKMEC